MKEIKRNKIIPYNPKLKELARELRKNSTPAEIVFWKMVKGKSLGVEFFLLFMYGHMLFKQTSSVVNLHQFYLVCLKLLC